MSKMQMSADYPMIMELMPDGTVATSRPCTQCELLKAWFDQGRSLTVAEALQKLGIYALSQRCGQLRREGYPITSEMIELGNGKRIARYSKLAVAYG